MHKFLIYLKGYGIIENLYQKPYKIIMACRNLKLAIESKDKLEK